MESSYLANKEKVEKNKIKSINKFNNLKSDYFLQKVFSNLERKKSINIVKYNNNIKERLNININDYKECSSIEIEIKPVNNKYGQFINYGKKDEKYYHIYFNNNEEEIKRNYINKNEKIKIIKIIIDYQVKSFENLFYNCFCIESINFKKFYRNNINNMIGMFSRCSSLKKLNLNNFNTNNVTYMNNMFSGCSSLKELNLNKFNTNNVTYMNNMFSECSSLIELNVNNFNINNVKDMSGMFSGCSSLKKLNLNNFNTNNDINMKGMFYRCSNELIKKIKALYKNIKIKAFLK